MACMVCYECGTVVHSELGEQNEELNLSSLNSTIRVCNSNLPPPWVDVSNLMYHKLSTRLPHQTVMKVCLLLPSGPNLDCYWSDSQFPGSAAVWPVVVLLEISPCCTPDHPLHFPASGPRGTVFYILKAAVKTGRALCPQPPLPPPLRQTGPVTAKLAGSKRGQREKQSSSPCYITWQETCSGKKNGLQQRTRSWPPLLASRHTHTHTLSPLCMYNNKHTEHTHTNINIFSRQQKHMHCTDAKK